MYNILFYDEGALGETQIGGGQLGELEIISKLDREVFSPYLLTSERGELFDEAKRKNINVIAENIKGKTPHLYKNEIKHASVHMINYFFHFFSSVKRLSHFLKLNNIHLIHPEGNLPRLITAFSLNFINIPSVTRINEEWSNNKINKIFIFLYLHYFDKLVAVSNSVKKSFIKYNYSNKLQTIYRGIDIDSFENKENNWVRKNFNIKSEDLIICMVGKLHKIKGHKYLFKAIQKLKLETDKAFKVLVVGNGPEKTNLYNLVDSLDINKNIIFTGFRKEIPEIMKSIDILVSSSLTEAFPRVILEGMASAKPIIATNVGGTKEAIKHGKTGFLVPPADYNALFYFLKLLIENSELRKKMGNNGKYRVKKYFSLEKEVKEFQKLYLNLLESKRKY